MAVPGLIKYSTNTTFYDYLNGIKKKYPSTLKVPEQIEELRDSLHIKTEEYQSRGMAYKEAAKAAIASMGDVGDLFEELSGNLRTVYVNRLNKNSSILELLHHTGGVPAGLAARFSAGRYFYPLEQWNGRALLLVFVFRNTDFSCNSPSGE